MSIWAYKETSIFAVPSHRPPRVFPGIYVKKKKTAEGESGTKTEILTWTNLCFK